VTATVNEERVAGQVPRVVTGQEHRHGRDVGFGMAQSAHGVRLVGLAGDLWTRSSHRAKGGRLGPGADDVVPTMPYCAHSRTAVRVKILSACLAQLYSVVPI
jgi:hypothetical protein